MFRYFSKQIRVVSGLLPFLLLCSLSAGVAVTSDRLSVSFNDDASELTFSGNVRVVSSYFTATCVEAKIIAKGKIDQIQSDLANIQHVWITGPLSLVQEDRQCTADAAEITPSDSRILLKGHAMIQSPMGTVSAPMIQINYTTKAVEVISDRKGNPVQVSVTQPTPAQLTSKTNRLFAQDNSWQTLVAPQRLMLVRDIPPVL